MKIADGIEMLEISMKVFRVDNVVCPVLIKDNDGITLVDTGYPGQLQQIREAIGNTGMHYQEIKRIILTHHDLDHIGCLAGIVNDLHGKVEVISHEIEKPYVQGDLKPLKLAQMEERFDSLSDQMKSLCEGMKRGYLISTAKVDTTVNDGDEIPYYGGIKLIHTPGHTHGHISLYIKRIKTLITGDAMFCGEGRLVAPPPSVNFNNEQAGVSINKLAIYDIEKVICYHGGFFGDNPNHNIAELTHS
jgi:glyoxylase-like metal-dependent hydrolase (beta-lactamase superfamily II)